MRNTAVTPHADRTKLSRVDDAGGPAVLIAWIECESCGRIDKAAHDFNYPADTATDMELFVWMPCANSPRAVNVINIQVAEACKAEIQQLCQGQKGKEPEPCLRN